ncbi:MAG: DUF58 domain-containing protein [Planctomycetota bacterium]|jgi:uncharacterized protein (DUF58 family)
MKRGPRAGLLTAEALESVQNLSLLARGIVDGFMTGVHRSPHLGVSVEFAEYREYTPGDPLKTLDWQVYARTDRYVVRRFHDETNLRACVVLDTSNSLAFRGDPSRPTKFRYATCLAAVLLHLLMRQRDAAGLVSFAARVGRYFPPRLSPVGMREMVEHLDSLRPDGETHAADALHHVAERMPHRSMVLVISDLLDDPDRVVAALKHLRHNRNEVIVFQVLDPAELRFPYRGLNDFRDLETEEVLEADADALRDAYVAAMEEFVRNYRRTCGDARIEHHVLETDTPFDRALAAVLRRRTRW